MGVHGLWRLLESTGKPINPETLEGKILAVGILVTNEGCLCNIIVRHCGETEPGTSHIFSSLFS